GNPGTGRITPPSAGAVPSVRAYMMVITARGKEDRGRSVASHGVEVYRLVPPFFRSSRIADAQMYMADDGALRSAAPIFFARLRKQVVKIEPERLHGDLAALPRPA